MSRSPRSTLINCGSSSSLALRMNLPTRVEPDGDGDQDHDRQEENQQDRREESVEAAATPQDAPRFSEPIVVDEIGRRKVVDRDPARQTFKKSRPFEDSHAGSAKSEKTFHRIPAPSLGDAAVVFPKLPL